MACQDDMGPIERRNRCNYNGNQEDSFVRFEYPRTCAASCVWDLLSLATEARILKIGGNWVICSSLKHHRCAEGCGPICSGLFRMGGPA